MILPVLAVLILAAAIIFFSATKSVESSSVLSKFNSSEDLKHFLDTLILKVQKLTFQHLFAIRLKATFASIPFLNK